MFFIMDILLLNSILLFLLSLVAQRNAKNILVAHKGYVHESSYLDPQISKFCPQNDTMLIKGIYVKFSDFVRTNGDIYNFCSYGIDLKYIYIFVLNSLLIDTDIDVSGSHLNIYIISPTWTVVGNRKIAVDGFKGYFIPKAEDGNVTNIDGQDGKPGLPGGPGGSFFGIGDTFFNGKSLTITANGGIGGTGQYGGDGYNPGQARYVDTNALGKIGCATYYDICRGTDKKYQINLLDNHGNYSDFYCQGLYEKENMEMCSYKIFGWDGELGGKGGNGGRGGKGGLPGSIQLLDLNNSSQIYTYTIPGLYGGDGRGGIGGKSGQNGYNVIYEDFYVLAPPKITIESGQEYHFSLNGSDGCNSIGYIEDLEKADIMEPYEILNTINLYKSWLRKSFQHNNMTSHIVPFYKHITENHYVRNLYNTSDLFNELDYLDEDLYSVTSIHDFIPFYECLLEQIYFFVETHTNDTNREDRQILSLLYTEILGRININNEHADKYLVLEVRPHLESIKENLEEVGNLIQQESDFDLVVETLNEISEYFDDYKKQVHELIIKSRHYVNSKFTPEMETFMQDEREKMSKLLSDIIRFKKRPINNEQELLTWGKRFHDSLIARSNIFSYLLINKAFGALSDFAEVVFLVVEFRANVPEVLRLGDQSPTDKMSMEVFQKLYNKTKEIKTAEVNSIIKLLQNILNKTKSNPEILFDVNEEVLLVYKKLKNDNRFLTINALRSDLLQAVKIKRDELSTMDLYPNNNLNANAYEHVLSARSAFIEIDRIIRITSISRGFIDLYDEYKHDDTKLDIIVEYINKVYNILHVQKGREDGIYSIVYQLMQSIVDNITTETYETSDSFLKLAFKVGQWTIPLILDLIEQKTVQLPDNYQCNDNFWKILEHLKGAGSVLTDVFEREKSFLQKLQLKNHMTDTNLAISKGITFENVLYATKYDTIAKALRSYLILQNYKKAVDTVKQYVFPLADVYFRDVILPSHFNIKDDIETIVFQAITQIDLMLEKVDEYQEFVLDGDGIVRRKYFGSRKLHSANPFFLWKNEEHTDMITKLLSGEEVTINAEIPTNISDVSEHAIKFNRIDFYFTSNNGTIQESVNSIMEYYKVYVSHLGDSHYRYGDKIYLIKSDTMKMFYFFQNNEDGQPIRSSGSYHFINNVDITLSPYTWWQVRLVPILKEVSFNDLLAFKDMVDLELGGYGFYISKENISTFDLKVDKYYNPL